MTTREGFDSIGRTAGLEPDEQEHFTAAMMRETDEGMSLPLSRYDILQREVEEDALFMSSNPMGQGVTLAYMSPTPLSSFYRSEHPRHNVTPDLFTDRPHAISIISEETLRNLLRRGILTFDHRRRVARVVANVRHPMDVFSMNGHPVEGSFMARPYLWQQNALAFEAEEGAYNGEGKVIFGKDALERYMVAVSAHRKNLLEGRGSRRILDMLYGRV